MGLRFRKSMKLGPLRINFSKSGIGYSYGVKGYRVTHTADGKVRTTASIPGTGISHVTETSARQANVRQKERPASGFAKVLLAVFVALVLSMMVFMLVSCSASVPEPETPEMTLEEAFAIVDQLNKENPVTVEPAPAPVEPEPEPAPDPEPAPAPEPDPEPAPKPEPKNEMLGAMQSLAPLMSSYSVDDEVSRLLNALRPFLGEEKLRRLDQAQRLMKLIKVIPLLKDSGLFF